MKLAVSAVCMPEYPPSLAAAKIKEWGYDAVEWHVNRITEAMEMKPISYWGKNKATIDFNNFLKNAAEVKKACDAEELAVCGLDFDNMVPGSDDTRLAFEGAALMGAPMVRFLAPAYDPARGYEAVLGDAVDFFGNVQDLAKEFGIRGMLENHADTVCPSAELMKNVVNNFDPAHIGVVLDPGNMIYEGFVHWGLALDILGPYLQHVHVKNAGWVDAGADETGDVSWQNVASSLLGGIVSWKALLKLLHGRGYDGWLAVEDYSQVRKTDAKLMDDRKLLVSILTGLA